MSRIFSAFISILLVGAFVSCEDEYIPKPRGYNRIEFPEKSYITYDSIYPFTFQYPAYAKVLPYQGSDGPHPYWLNIYFPKLKATLHLSYLGIESENELIKMIEDSRRLVFKHTVKAEEIIENYLDKPGKYGIVYELTGSTASALQFYITDSTQHFLRGSLYFNVATNPDSVAPVINFINKDVERFLESLSWKLK
jgi:gliding motility-associated lipoprotein GldD